MRSNTKVFITGAGGFIGQAICRCLAQDGYTVFRYCLTTRQYNPSQHGQAIYGDSFTQDALVSALGQCKPDFIIHLASAGVLEGDSDPRSLFNINVQATNNLVHAAATIGGCRIIHTGSCSEYACREPELLTESSPVGAANYYGATKAASVQLLLGLSRLLSVPAVVLRPFNVYGVGESSKRLIPYLIQQQLAGAPCELTHGFQKKDFLYVDDAARGYLKAVIHFDDLEPNGVYNLCTGVPTNLRMVGEKIVRLMQGDAGLYRWGARKPRAGEPLFIVGDPSRFIEATGWKPTTELDLGLAETIAYYRNQAIHLGNRRQSIAA